MILLGITILIFIIGILCIIKAYSDVYSSDDWEFSGMMILVISGIPLIIELMILLIKPLNYKNFKIKYDTIKETITSKDDIRDATFTSQLIEINQEIKSCNEYKNSAWVGIFQNERICEMDYLKKESDKNV